MIVAAPVILGLVTAVALDQTVKFVKRNKSPLTSEDKQYINAMYVIRNKDTESKINIQKAQQFLGDYILK